MELYGWDANSVTDIRHAVQDSQRQPARSVRVSRAITSGGSRAVVVELLTMIEADDAEPQEAKLMELLNGEWVDTKDRVEVRNVGNEPLDSGVRYLAAPVGNLGLCIGG